MSEIKTIYFAGKVKKGGGYRGILLGDSYVMSRYGKIYEVGGGSVAYGGPMALSCDHGCFHGDGTHGLMGVGCSELGRMNPPFVDRRGEDKSPEDMSHGTYAAHQPKRAVARCFEHISMADAVHCFLETTSSYGTLVELGFASAIMKPIYIYYAQGKHRWDKHFWFCMNLPSVVSCEPGTATSFHPDLIARQKTYKERYYEYLQSPEWDFLRKAKLREADHRCQLCNASKTLHVHHRTYDNVFHERLQDLIALCEDCHEKFHSVVKDNG